MGKQGFNLIGYATSPLGLGEDLRAFAGMLDYLGMPFSVIDVPTDATGKVEVRWQHMTTETYPVSFFFMAPMECDRIAREYPRLFSEPKVKVGYFLWELPDYPVTFRRALQLVDHIWCPTSFVQQSFLDAVRKLVLALPLPVPVTPPSKRNFRKELGIPPKAFVALYMFDMHSTVNRKNPHGAVEAFKEFAKGKDDVYLVLKLNRWESTPPEKLAWLPKDPRIKLLMETLDGPGLSALYRSADCYLSLHRAEGFGRTLVEAMQQGIVLITTDFSGPADFVSEENSLLVEWSRKEMGPADYPNADPSWWAEPSVADAARKLQAAYDGGVQKRVRGAKKTGEGFTVEALAERYRPILGHYLKTK